MPLQDNVKISVSLDIVLQGFFVLYGSGKGALRTFLACNAMKVRRACLTECQWRFAKVWGVAVKDQGQTASAECKSKDDNYKRQRLNGDITGTSQ